MKLYGSLASPYVARVVMYARLKGIDLPLEETPGGSLKSPEYLKLNPIGKVPALEVDGIAFGESTIICDYLEDTHTAQPGLPRDPVDRARSRLVARITDLYIAQHLVALFRNMNPASRDAAVVEAAGRELAKAFGHAEHVMGPGPFCVADVPTLGDCALAPTTVLVRTVIAAGRFDIPDPAGTPRLKAWWQAVEGNAVCAGVLAEHTSALQAFMKSMAARR